MQTSKQKTSNQENISVQNWGLVPYEIAMERQLQVLEEVAATNSAGVLVFCTHPHVVTTGRATKEGDVTDFRGPVIEVSRGGRATYHGPSQLVVYPILNLNQPRKNRKEHEIVGVIRELENAIIECLKDFGIQAIGRSLQKRMNSEFLEEETGVWVGDKKIASLGMAVRKWISYHGAAINLDQDSQAFVGLKPCGFTTETMISAEQILGTKIDRESFQKKLEAILLRAF